MAKSFTLLGAGGAAASAAPFSPSDVAGITGWWKADSESYANDDPVATATDRSGGGRDMTAAGSARPTFKTGIINGLPVFRFDGTANVLANTAQLSSYVTNSAYTLYAICSVTAYLSDIGYNSNESIISEWVTGGYWGLGLKATGTNVAMCNYDGTLDVANLSLATATWVILEGRHESGTVYLNKNGAGEVSVVSGNTAGMTHAVRIGRGASTKYFNGDIAEIVVYNAAASSGDRASLRAYFGTKYNISTL